MKSRIDAQLNALLTNFAKKSKPFYGGFAQNLQTFWLSLILGWFSIYPTFNYHMLTYLSYAYLYKSRWNEIAKLDGS